MPSPATAETPEIPPGGPAEMPEQPRETEIPPLHPDESPSPDIMPPPDTPIEIPPPAD